MINTDESLIEELNRRPPTDASGDVDLEQIRYNLSLTAAERLNQLERFIQFVCDARRHNGIE